MANKKLTQLPTAITPSAGDKLYIVQGGVSKQIDAIDFVGATPAAVNGSFSVPPTTAELNTLLGSPATVGSGYQRFIDKSGAHTNVYTVGSDGVNWWYAAMSKAITPSSTPARMGLWVWADDWDTQAEIDALVAYSAGRITDLWVDVTKATSPKELLGVTTLCHQTATTIGGVTPLAYLITQAHAQGIKVHAWWIVYVWTYWGGATACLVTPLADNGTNHDTSAGGSTINFSTAGVRSTIIAAMNEFYDSNPGLDGMMLDYIRTDGTVTGQTDANVTSFVSELRTSLPAPEISVCALSVFDLASAHHQDVATWLTSNYVNTVCVMGYYYNIANKMHIWDGWNLTGKTLILGIGNESTEALASDNRASIRQFKNAGYTNMTVFCWWYLLHYSNLRDPIDEYLAGDIDTTAPYPTVTSVTVTPDTSIALVIGGTTFTTLNSAVTDHTTTGSLKGHIEGVEGQRPWIHYRRPTTGTIDVQVGDWLP